MDGIGLHWRSAAERAQGDLFLMIAICDVVCSSSHASIEQLIVAKSARQSLLIARGNRSDLQIEIATSRYQKLVKLLVPAAADELVCAPKDLASLGRDDGVTSAL